MYCAHCGSALDNNAKFCANCGAPVKQPEPVSYQPQYTYQPQTSTPPTFYTEPSMAPAEITFGDAVMTFFRKYAVFSGRATRKEYWYVILFNFVVSMAFGLLASIAPDLGSILSSVYSLAIIIPGLALFTRRMHDIGKSGWCWLWSLVPLVGVIVLLIFLCRASGEDNKYGPKPV